MRKFSIRKKVWLTAAAAVLAGGISLQGAMAYFTACATAEGGAVLELGHTAEIQESFENWTKDIQITNTGDVDCYIRVKVLSGSRFTLDIGGDGWSAGNDGYWYYGEAVAPDDKTGSLLARITIPQDFAEDFNVAVVQECTPVLYNEDGTPYADWNFAMNEGGMN